MPCYFNNIDLLKQNGLTVYLDTDVEFPWFNKKVKRGLIVGSGLPDEEGDPQNGGKKGSKHTRRKKLRIHHKKTRRVYQ